MCQTINAVGNLGNYSLQFDASMLEVSSRLRSTAHALNDWDWKILLLDVSLRAVNTVARQLSVQDLAELNNRVLNERFFLHILVKSKLSDTSLNLYATLLRFYINSTRAACAC